MYEEQSKAREAHHVNGHTPKEKTCLPCQLACGPAYRHMTYDETDKHRAILIINVDVSGPHVVGWPCDYVYLLVAVA